MNMINDKIKELRINNGYSQQKLANMLNISRQALGHYEKGDREPNIDMIKKLCAIFDIDANELLELNIDKERKKLFINNSFNNNSGKQNIKF